MLLALSLGFFFIGFELFILGLAHALGLTPAVGVLLMHVAYVYGSLAMLLIVILKGFPFPKLFPNLYMPSPPEKKTKLSPIRIITSEHLGWHKRAASR